MWEDAVCEAVENQALEGDADHELLLGLGGLPGWGHKLGFDLVSPVEHLRDGVVMPGFLPFLDTRVLVTSPSLQSSSSCLSYTMESFYYPALVIASIDQFDLVFNVCFNLILFSLVWESLRETLNESFKGSLKGRAQNIGRYLSSFWKLFHVLDF